MKTTLAILALVALCACSSTQQDAINAATASPTGKAITYGAAAAAIEAVNEYNDTGKVDQKKVEAAAAKAAVLTAVSGS